MGDQIHSYLFKGVHRNWQWLQLARWNLSTFFGLLTNKTVTYMGSTVMVHAPPIVSVR